MIFALPITVESSAREARTSHAPHAHRLDRVTVLTGLSQHYSTLESPPSGIAMRNISVGVWKEESCLVPRRTGVKLLRVGTGFKWM